MSDMLVFKHEGKNKELDSCFPCNLQLGYICLTLRN
jgi:hypothetical protein